MAYCRLCSTARYTPCDRVGCPLKREESPTTGSDDVIATSGIFDALYGNSVSGSDSPSVPDTSSDTFSGGGGDFGGGGSDSTF